MQEERLLLDSYRLWLENRHLSSATIRNYVSDANRYFKTIPSNNPFSSDSLKSYLNQKSADNNYPRYLASISLFCQFGVDQKLIEKNPIHSLRHDETRRHLPKLPDLFNMFKAHLVGHQTPSSTVKNYISDLQLYYHWLESTPNDS